MAKQQLDTMICLRFIGQSGVVISLGSDNVVIDPYLSDSVARKFGRKFRRQIPVPDVSGWGPNLRSILLTHAHLDHTDPTSIRLLLNYAPQARVYGPLAVRRTLDDEPWMQAGRIRSPRSQWFEVADGITARSVPAAHVDCETDEDRRQRYIGYFLNAKGKLIYHAGDTVIHPDVLRAVRSVGRPDVALIPFNERNYYREKHGIIGNLTVREALSFARDIGAKMIIPIHWDMFALNSVLPEEIALLSSRLAPELRVRLLRCGDRIKI